MWASGGWSRVAVLRQPWRRVSHRASTGDNYALVRSIMRLQSGTNEVTAGEIMVSQKVGGETCECTGS